MAGTGTKDDPWQLHTAPGTSAFQMWLDLGADPPLLKALGLAESTHEPRNNRIRAI